jgi:hypothetical protein
MYRDFFTISIFLLFVVSGFSQSDKTSKGYVLIKTKPAGAEISIFKKGEYYRLKKGNSPLSVVLEKGEYTYQISKNFYKSITGEFTIDDSKTKTLELKLEPEFGSLDIQSNPIEGANIYIDNERLQIPLNYQTFAETPYFIDSIKPGKYHLKLEMYKYDIWEDEFVIENGKTTKIKAELIPQFGIITVNGPEEGVLYIKEESNGRIYDQGRYSLNTPIKLDSGIYHLNVKMSDHTDWESEIEISAGKIYSLDAVLSPHTGNIFMETTPPEIKIFMDGEFIGRSPLVINSVKVGRHKILLKNGSIEIIVDANIRKNEELYLHQDCTNKLGDLKINSTCKNEEKWWIEQEELQDFLIKDSGNFTDFRDGQKYQWIRIGDQIWMDENLNYGSMIDADEEFKNNQIIEKKCFNNSLEECYKKGGNYNWYEAMNYSKEEGSIGICPEGWHIPSRNEWESLNQEQNTFKNKNEGYIWLSTLESFSPSVGLTQMPKAVMSKVHPFLDCQVRCIRDE